MKITFQSVVIYTVLLLAFLILATRLATVLHEVLGHALAAWCTGGHVSKIVISKFGGGKVHAELLSNNIVMRVWFSFAGMIVNLLTGMFSLYFLHRPNISFRPVHLFWAVFALASILGTTAYFVIGLYYHVGDPVSWVTQDIPRWFSRTWIAGVLISPVLSLICMRCFLNVQDAFIPTRTPLHKAGLTFVTLGTAAMIYAILFFTTNQSIVSWDAPDIAHKRDMADRMSAKKQTILEELKKQYPGLPERELLKRAEELLQRTSLPEIPRKFPIYPVVFCSYLIGGLAAFCMAGNAINVLRYKLSITFVVFLGITAFLVILILAYTKGIIYG